MGTISNVGNILLPAGSTNVNVQALLDAATAAAEQPLILLQQQQAQVQTKSATLTSIESDVTALATAVTAIGDTGSGISAQTATTSNSGILTASADSTAATQTHSITVNSLATTSTYYTDPVASASTPIAAGSFTLAVGTNAPVTVTVDSTDNTLEGLASAINAKNAGVSANVVNDANGARLSIVANVSGTPGDLSISGNSAGLVFNKAVSGLNASLTVDGVPVNATSNTISSVIAGVTLNLGSAAPATPVTVNVSPDTTNATAAINTFVSAWNKVMQDFNAQFTVGANGANAQPLESDGTVRDVQQQLLSAITYSIGGNGGFVNLASIGVDLQNDGSLTVNSATLSDALANHFPSVQSLLQGASGLATYMSGVLNQVTDPTQGSIPLDLQGMTQSNQDFSNQISDMQATLQNQQQFLTAQYDQVQVALQELPLIQNQITQQLGSLK